MTTPRPIEQYPVASDLPAPPPAPDGDAPAASAPAPRRAVEVAALEFIGGDASVAVPLAFPFRWEGREVRVIEVRRVSMVAIAQASLALEGGDDFELYALTTDYPAPALRGLMREDREAVARAADRFLSLEAGEAPSAPTPANGDASRSSPAAP